MEPRGCNRWQPAANRPALETAKQAKSVATGCHRLRREVHGKQGVCRGLPPVAGGPLPAKEGVELQPAREFALLLIAVRAGTLAAAAAGARPADHADMLSRPSGGTRGRGHSPVAAPRSSRTNGGKAVEVSSANRQRRHTRAAQHIEGEEIREG